MVVKWLLQKRWRTVFNRHEFCVRKCEAVANGYRLILKHEWGSVAEHLPWVDTCVIPRAGKEMKEGT